MGSVTGAKAPSPVLSVDHDNTPIRGNLLWECVLALLKTHPVTLFFLPFWLLSGRAFVERHLAGKPHLNPARLPYRQQVIDLLQQERAAGRRIALVPAAYGFSGDRVSYEVALAFSIVIAASMLHMSL